MNSRERFLCAMNHKKGDRVPVDIGGTMLTGLRDGCQKKLLDYLGFTGKAPALNGNVDERILEWAGCDFREVGGIASLPSPHPRVISDTHNVDFWGVGRQLIGTNWDITDMPLKNATVQDLKEYKWPEPVVDEKWLESVQDRAKTLKNEDKYVVIAEHPTYGILELGCWMCGYDSFLLNLAADPDFIRTFIDIVTPIQMKVIDTYYSALDGLIDLTMSGDDFGTQRGTFMSVDMFAEYIAPYYKARISRTKELAHCYFWHHSCGSIFTLLDQLIACGVDILNPIQTSAAMMEPERLKKHFGDKIVFWGAVDVQQFLTNASPEEVKVEIVRLLDILGENGGYVMAPAHEMQDDIPPQNIVAWVEALKNYYISK